MESLCWFSFKDKSGAPILFYNSETGEHRWTEDFRLVKCSRATLDEIPPQGAQFEFKTPRRTVTVYRDVATETNNDCVTSSISEVNEGICNVQAKTSAHCGKIDLKSASLPRNPFDVDTNGEEIAEEEFDQNKESLVHNLFSMELSSVLSEEDFEHSKDGKSAHRSYVARCGIPSGISNDLKANGNIRNETVCQLGNGRELDEQEKMENGVKRDETRTFIDGQKRNYQLALQNFNQAESEKETEKLDPILTKIKSEPDSEEAAVNLTAGDFCLVDLLPKKTVLKCACPFCPASFKGSYKLERHKMFVHPELITISRPHICNYCDKKFVDSHCLKKHLRTHTGEKPYRCPFCGKCFAQSQNLNKHKYIHTGSRPHACKDCGKTFRQHSHLKRHLLIHTGQKPYQCGECPKNYRTRSHLMRHFKTSKHKEIIDKTKCLQLDFKDKQT